MYKRQVVEVDGKKYLGARLLIATGSMPMIPPVKGLDEAIKSGFALTKREILDLEEIPKSLVIVGGGVIGLEMASYFNSVGSQVTIIEMLDLSLIHISIVPISSGVSSGTIVVRNSYCTPLFMINAMLACNASASVSTFVIEGYLSLIHIFPTTCARSDYTHITF